MGYYIFIVALIIVIFLFYYFKNWPKFVIINIRDREGQLFDIGKNGWNNYSFKLQFWKISAKGKLETVTKNPLEKRIWMGREKIFVQLFAVKSQTPIADTSGHNNDNSFDRIDKSQTKLLEHYTVIDFKFDNFLNKKQESSKR